MATLAEHPAVAPASYDQDIESFLHLDQLTYTPSEQARSKNGLPTQPSLPSSDFVSSDARSSSFASSSQSPVAFPAPSHQYDEHKQQTGLPPGALAQAMPIAHIPQMGFSAPSPGFAMNGEMFQPQIKTDVALDFNSTPSRNHSEMDLEADSSMNTAPAFFFSPNVKPNQYIDPNALGGQEVFSMGPSTQVGRMYPGMHQRAAMAKAAQQQREHDLVRHQQPQQLLQQPHNPGTPQTQHPRVSNPLVDERISRLLQQMKAGSASPSDSSPSPSSMPQMAKSRKDEQDMDEDERLLASEEGKKLSSKERRQLRNKVSARAFRSRRKEYIGHLESEVQQRNNEVQELRTQNRALFEENARLTDLARTLLSSPHFSQVLDEMNISGLPAVPSQQPQQQPQPQPSAIPQPQMQPQNIPKEPTPNHPQQEYALQQSSQMGMMMVPSQGIDVTAMNMNNGGWNTGIDMSFGNPSVFAVFEVPEPPVLDTEALTGKSPSFSGVSLPETSIKEGSQLGFLPSVDGQTPADAGDSNVEIDESDPVLALFADQPKQSVKAVPCESSSADIELAKPSLELIVDGGSSSAATRFDYLCHSMEAAFQRVSMMTAHLA